MASRTVYTSTITVPVYASWKCEECGEYSGVRVPSVRAQETVIPFLKKPPFR